jgi:hypothetical protein
MYYMFGGTDLLKCERRIKSEYTSRLTFAASVINYLWMDSQAVASCKKRSALSLSWIKIYQGAKTCVDKLEFIC